MFLVEVSGVEPESFKPYIQGITTILVPRGGVEPPQRAFATLVLNP